MNQNSNSKMKTITQKAQSSLSQSINMGRQEKTVSEHIKNAAIIEKAYNRAIQSKGNKFEMLGVLFEEIIKCDPYYGKMLKEIKKGYDEVLEGASARAKSSRKSDLEKLTATQKELSLLKADFEQMAKQNANLAVELKAKQIAVDSQKQKIEELTAKINSNQIQSENLATEPAEIIPKIIDKPPKKPKTFNVPKLDLSRIKNKYADEKIVIAQVKETSDDLLDLNSSVSDTPHKDILSEFSKDVPKKPLFPSSNKLNASMMMDQYKQNVKSMNTSSLGQKGILKEQSGNADNGKIKGIKGIYEEMWNKSKLGIKDNSISALINYYKK